ncbi:MAG: hypothetical protein GC206_07115 [Alphaproteobacteria bacterium]|nr:hypothetical protein [Alphaproteobacteria bacterium]
MPLLAGAALTTGCGTVASISSTSAPGGVAGCSGTTDLRQYEDTRLNQMAEACRRAAQDTRASNLQAAIANYNAGRIWKAQGQFDNGFERPELATAPVWTRASEALEAALANLPTPAPAGAGRGNELSDATWANAKLELSQVRAFMGDWEGALEHATDVYERSSDARQADALYQRARLHLQRYQQDPNPSYRERAFDDLSRLSVFQSDQNSATLRDAQRLVVELAKTLGDNALADRNLDRARSVFVAGREAARAISRGTGNGDNDFQVATFNLGLGKIEVLRAGLTGPDELGGCDARPLYPSALNAAVTEHLNSDLPEADRWAGCALLALGQLTPALRRFEDAAQSTEGSVNPNTQISLARALREASRNEASGVQRLHYRDQSLNAYSTALGLLPAQADAEKRAIVLVEAASVILEYARAAPNQDWRPEGCEARIAAAAANDPLARADSPPLACAVSMLTEAVELAPEAPDAYLQLAAVYGDMTPTTPDGARLRSVFNAAFANAREAVRRAGEDSSVRARANFHLSSIAETGIARGLREGRQANGDMVALSAVAVSSADEAARLAPELFTSQACLTRLSAYGRMTLSQRYLDRGRAHMTESARYCETDRNQPVSLLYEGMYHLAQTYYLSDTRQSKAQSDAWENALQSFRAGEAALDADLTGGFSTQDRQAMRDRLLTGQAIAYECAGFRNAAAEIRTRTTQSGDTYFFAHGFRECAARRVR